MFKRRKVYANMTDWKENLMIIYGYSMRTNKGAQQGYCI